MTVDYLVKDNEGCIHKPTELNSCSEDELRRFLLKAKNNTYAGEGSECPPSRPLSHDFKFEENGLLYIDSYIGGQWFSGEEAVWKENNPIWAMNYSGRVIGENFSGDFLKSALREVPYDKLYRGPSYFHDGEYIYICKVDGTFEWYQGYEEILYHDEKIYECYFHGGKVKE